MSMESRTPRVYQALGVLLCLEEKTMKAVCVLTLG